MNDDKIKDLSFDLTLLALQSFDFGGECSFEDAKSFRDSAYELIKSALDSKSK